MDEIVAPTDHSDDEDESKEEIINDDKSEDKQKRGLVEGSRKSRITPNQVTLFKFSLLFMVTFVYFIVTYDF